jgi:hypothetical protein
VASGIDISQLGIKGYSSSTDLSKLSEEELKEILSQLKTIKTNQAKNEQDLKKTIRQA